MVRAYAAIGPKCHLEPFQFTRERIGFFEVEIEISHCGICYSDVHLIDGDFAQITYPFVPGHEIIGKITKRGRMVKGFALGEQVGVGWQSGSCFSCEWCMQGDEHLCPVQQATCIGNYGGFAESIRVDSRFVHPIPKELSFSPAAASSLLCGGLTVYSAFRSSRVSSPMKVGVIGIGGLGHLALQFAHAFGCEVTGFSTTPEKENDARTFGAHHFVLTKDSEAMRKTVNSLDFVLSTVYVNLDWSLYFDILRPNGTLCVVGIMPGSMEIPSGSLTRGQKIVRGSPTGNRSTMREMLEFAALHGIRAEVEVVEMRRVNEAIERLRRNQARYRIVLTND
jgi:uncharacterized zinc-type alcohol dehydrogenase-like protein